MFVIAPQWHYNITSRVMLITLVCIKPVIFSIDPVTFLSNRQPTTKSLVKRLPTTIGGGWQTLLPVIDKSIMNQLVNQPLIRISLLSLLQQQQKPYHKICDVCCSRLIAPNNLITLIFNHRVEWIYASLCCYPVMIKKIKLWQKNEGFLLFSSYTCA